MAEYIRSKDLERVFRKLDMTVDRRGHHVRAELRLDGRTVVRVAVAQGRKELPVRIVHMLRRSFRLTPDEFRDLVRCTMTRDEYLEILRLRLEEDKADLR